MKKVLTLGTKKVNGKPVEFSQFIQNGHLRPWDKNIETHDVDEIHLIQKGNPDIMEVTCNGKVLTVYGHWNDGIV